MDIETLRNYCLEKKETTEAFPFDEVTLVFKVMGKIFAIVGLDHWEAGKRSINLKCDPEYAIELREQYESIKGGYHMNKKHWNTVSLENDEIDTKMLQMLIDHSYEQVIKSLPKKTQEKLHNASFKNGTTT